MRRRRWRRQTQPTGWKLGGQNRGRGRLPSLSGDSSRHPTDVIAEEGHRREPEHQGHPTDCATRHMTKEVTALTASAPRWTGWTEFDPYSSRATGSSVSGSLRRIPSILRNALPANPGAWCSLPSEP
jgi:hypothetical protein